MGCAPKGSGHLPMSFDLPRGPRTLSFTGAVRSLATAGSVRSPLGRARPKAPAPTAERSVPVPSPVPEAVDEIPDDVVTLAFDRDAVDRAVLPDARIATDQPPPSSLPIPHFRSTLDHARNNATPGMIRRRPNELRLPIGVWLVAALLAGFVSFYAAPQVRATLSHADTAQGLPAP